MPKQPRHHFRLRLEHALHQPCHRPTLSAPREALASASRSAAPIDRATATGWRAADCVSPAACGSKGPRPRRPRLARPTMASPLPRLASLAPVLDAPAPWSRPHRPASRHLAKVVAVTRHALDGIAAALRASYDDTLGGKLVQADAKVSSLAMLLAMRRASSAVKARRPRLCHATPC